MIDIHVVVGIVSNSKNQILIAQRPAHKYCAGLWEFPGGKVELHETAFEALQREFREEIGIQIISAKSWFQTQHNYPDRSVLLDVWVIENFSGEPHGAEGQSIRWVLPNEFQQFEFPEGNRVILEKLLNF